MEEKATVAPKATTAAPLVFFGKGAEADSIIDERYNYADYEKMEHKVQNMPGFDSQYKNFVHYIIAITHQIWEERGIGIIYETYHSDITMHLGSYNLEGLNDVIGNTLQTLFAFPDRRLIGENVVWSHEEENGFYSSHRIVSTATNLGASGFGPATGKRVFFRTTVDCAAKNNRIYEEWLVRDNLYLVQQLGLDPHEVAKKMAESFMLKSSPLQNSFSIDESRLGQRVPAVTASSDKGFEVGSFIQRLFQEVWQSKYFNKVSDFYHENAVVSSICDQELVGYSQIQGFLVSFFASLPNARVLVERITCNDAAGKDNWNVSVRWIVSGLNNSLGYFGQPSGKTLKVFGITHYSISGGKIAKEWMTFDGLDVLRQMYMGSDASKRGLVAPAPVEVNYTINKNDSVVFPEAPSVESDQKE